MHIEPPFRERAMRFVLDEFGITLDDLLSSSRRKELAEARSLFVWIIRSYRPSVSYQTIGSWIGIRHHTSVIEAHARAVRLRLSNADFDDACERFAALYRSTGDIHACH